MTDKSRADTQSEASALRTLPGECCSLQQESLRKKRSVSGSNVRVTFVTEIGISQMRGMWGSHSHPSWRAGKGRGSLRPLAKGDHLSPWHVREMDFYQRKMGDKRKEKYKEEMERLKKEWKGNRSSLVFSFR